MMTTYMLVILSSHRTNTLVILILHRHRTRKEGRNWVLRRFQQLRSYRNEIETRNREEIPKSSRIVQRGLSVAEGA